MFYQSKQSMKVPLALIKPIQIQNRPGTLKCLGYFTSRSHLSIHSVVEQSLVDRELLNLAAR